MIRFKMCNIGTACAAGCSLCNDASSSPLSFNEIKTNITSQTAPDSNVASCTGIIIDGHEPFMHPQLPEIIRALASQGYKRIAVRTDGGALANPQSAFGCIGSGVRTFVVSLLGADEYMHDKRAGAAGLYRAMTQGIVNVRRAAADQDVSVAIIVRIEICIHNSSELVALAQTALRLMPDAVEVLNHSGAALSPTEVRRAHAMSVAQGIYLFGDDCADFLNGQRLYEVVV